MNAKIRSQISTLLWGVAVAAAVPPVRGQDTTHWQRDMVLGPQGGNNKAPREPRAPTIEDKADQIDDLGRECMDNDDYEGALAYFQQAYDLSQLERYAKYYRADIARAKAAIASRDGNRAMNAGLLSEALALFQKSAELKPDWKFYREQVAWAKGVIQFSAGKDARLSGDLAAALAAFNQAQAVYPNSVYKDAIAQVRQEIAERATKEKQDRKAVASLQHAVQDYIQALQKVHVQDANSLDFVAVEATPPPPPVAASPAVVSAPTEELHDAVSDGKVRKGPMGSNVADVHFSTVTAPKPGDDTKAGDQAMAGYKIATTGEDLTPLYDGGASQAGSLPVLGKADPEPMSDKVKNDSRMIEALGKLDAAGARRAESEEAVRRAEIAFKTAPDAVTMAARQKELDARSAEHQEAIAQVTIEQINVRKVHRTIDAEETPISPSSETKASAAK